MDVVKQGYVKIRSKRLSLWKKRWIILRRASSKGPVRIEKFIDEKSSRYSRQPPKSMLLNYVSSVSRLSSSLKLHSFAINFDQSSQTPDKWFACDSDLEADSWVKLLIQECLIPESGLATGEPDILSPGIQKELQEQFHVYLMPNAKLDAFGECLLQVTPENIYLWDVSNSKLKLCAWPLTALRRYGSDPTKFTFEAGRHCATGEGMFIFHTLVGEKIYRKVHQATLAIAEAHQKSKRRATSPAPSTANTSNTVTATSNNNSSSTPQYSSNSTRALPPAPITATTVGQTIVPPASSFNEASDASNELRNLLLSKRNKQPDPSHLESSASFYSASTHLTQPSNLIQSIEELEAVTV